jgi:hypothetical protein
MGFVFWDNGIWSKFGIQAFTDENLLTKKKSVIPERLRPTFLQVLLK